MSFVMNYADYSSPSQLSLYDVVLFIDDSGSMLEGSKWRDLQAIAQQIVEMTTQFDTDGIQVKTNCFVGVVSLYPSHCQRPTNAGFFR